MASEAEARLGCLQQGGGASTHVSPPGLIFDGQVEPATPSPRRTAPKLADRAWRDPVRDPPTFHNAAPEDRDAILAHYMYDGRADVWDGCGTDEIVPGLFLGTGADAAYWPFLSGNQITHILCVAGQMYKATLADDPMPFGRKGVTYLQQVWGDSIEDAKSMYSMSAVKRGAEFKRIMDATGFIQKAMLGSGSVLVHCVHGISRSATVVTAYLMQYHGKSFKDAKEHIKQRHPTADTNVYNEALARFEQFLQDREDLPRS